MKKIVVIITILCSNYISSQENFFSKDTIFIILKHNAFKNVINDSLIYDKKLGWYINIKKIGQTKYSGKNSTIDFCGTGKIYDTIILGQDYIKGLMKIEKTIYPNVYNYTNKIKYFSKFLDSCDIKYEKDHYNKRLQCYHSFNFIERVSPIKLFRYDINKMREDSSKKYFPIAKHYFNLKDLYRRSLEKKNHNIYSFINYADNPILLSIEQIDTKKYTIYINEEDISEDEDFINSKRKIQFSEYLIHKLYRF